ncbi:hypothetical protein VHEMI03482 [[Torrubiella] hemipterigena]|uniref:FAD-binding domain-containing protein n=1 Tax=[Torrubiella] hemipterigena TaxID=1531966 RepID=A0A0A1TBB3_9HYPO|nr:hypothetical protein VHEMI03482 [[Torrubiella] hemipterigena]
MAVEQQIEYAIVGGGISGLTLAIALLERGLSVHIYEQAKEFGEIGAGVSFTPNSVQAMKLCHPGIYDAFEKVCTRNLWPSKQGVWFDFYDGLDTDKNASSVFSIRNDLGQNAVHRANFLDELVKLMPEGKASFGKRLDDIIQNEDGRYTLKFLDGSSAIADAVLGCDGIKSKAREIMFGSDHPCVVPSYTFKNAYRAMLPMETAIAAIGKEKAENACMHLGRGAHLLTFPVRHGQMMNVVGFCGTDQPWKDMRKLTAPATREDALRDFAGFGPVVTSLLQLAEPTLEIVSCFLLCIACNSRQQQTALTQSSGVSLIWASTRLHRM